MAITLADFNKIWASSSPLTPYSFTENNYKQGWNFVGSTPPARQMWDFLQKNNDKKMQYLANNYLPLSGGTMTGSATIGFAYQWGSIYSAYTNDAGSLTFLGGSGDNKGARIRLSGMNRTGYEGFFEILAHNGTTGKSFIGKPDGTLTWGGNAIALSKDVLPLSGGTMTGNIEYKTSNNLLFNIHSEETYVNIGWIYTGNHGSLISLRNTNHTNNPGGFEIFARNSSNEKTLIGKPDGTLTWNGKSIPQRSYGVNLGANTTHTFDIAENGAVIFAKRGNNASCHMVTVWDATSTQFFVSGTDPITVSVSVGAKTATITNVSASSVAVKIINGGAL